MAAETTIQHLKRLRTCDMDDETATNLLSETAFLGIEGASVVAIVGDIANVVLQIIDIPVVHTAP